MGIISNLRDADSAPIGGLGSGEVKWHSDQSYVSNPATGCLLYAVELPGDGGITSWASLTTASEALPDGLRAAITGKRAIYSYSKRLAGYSAVDAAISPEMKARTPDVTHLLLQRHPVTGREALYFEPKRR